MDLKEIDQQLAQLNAQIEPLLKQQSLLVKARRRLKSKQWIEVNKVTRDQFEEAPQPGDRFDRYGERLSRLANPKRFVEFNGRIHFTVDVIAGRQLDNEAFVDDLPE